MQKHLLYINLFAITSALAFTACTDEVDNIITPDVPETGVKTPIELSVGILGEENSQTRAITVLPTQASKYRAFKNSTSLYMIMKSDDVSTTGTTRDPKYTRTFGLAGKVDNPADGSFSAIDFTRESGKFIRYWDDAYSRESALSIYAICLPGCNGYGENGIQDSRTVILGGGTSFQNIGWTTTAMTTILPDWTISGLDNSNGLALNDICYSNNISEYTIGENTTDNRIKYIESSKQFDRTKKMVFYHAAAKFTFVINKGNGFAASETFAFETGTNIKLTGFNNKVSGFDLATGDFSTGGGYTVGDIAKLWEDNTSDKVANSEYTLRGLVFPSTDMTIDDNSTSASDTEKANAKNAVSFTINGNKYIVSRKQLYDAILNKKNSNGQYVYSNGTAVSEDYLTGGTQLKAGVHYIFTFTINKTQISNITASVVDWETVVAEEQEPSNAYVTLSLKKDEGTNVNTEDPQFDLYRAKDPTEFTGSDYAGWAQYSWETGYTADGAKATLEQTSSTTPTVYTAKDAITSTQWYWPNNTTYYHFRTINKGLSVNSGDIDKVSIFSGPINDAYHATDISKDFADNKFNDYLWGAPFKNSVTSATAYSSQYGFCNNATSANGQIYHAIGATKDNILLIQHHMMSNIYVDLETTGTDPDAVNLDGATVKIVRFAKDAKIQMGNGLVTGWSSFDDGTGTAMTFDVVAAVTSGDNQHPAYDYSYRMVPQPLKRTDNTTVGIEITAADGNVYKINDLSQQKVNATTSITEWLPGKKYYYKFTLKKTGIENISATIVDWENVEADDETVTIQ